MGTISNFLSKPVTINGVALLRYHLKNERICSVYRIARVDKINAIEGVILLTKNGIYIVDGLTVDSNHSIVESIHAPEHLKIPNIETRRVPFNDSSFFKHLPYSSIMTIRKKRYSLMSIAVEMFEYLNNSYLLVFEKERRKNFFKKFTELLRKNPKFYNSKGRLDALFLHFEPLIFNMMQTNLEEITAKWMNREIDNFQYLLYLNVKAGRGFNDLSQYPVFPWVLSDYTSEELNLLDQNVYRDLSKPMGALDEKRLKLFIERYEDWDEPAEAIPKYLYATFYSTSMAVCSFLIRMEPYSSNFVELQGGNFDLPNRIFHSIHQAWLSSAVKSSSDFKELTPEFYYISDFLVNNNKFKFGKKQDGTDVQDVILPPWAKNDPREFIRLNRAALESEYVSNNIHHWIDLIFGYKQKGKDAIASRNVFHPWFYKGVVDVKNTVDPTIKKSVITFIANFGQVPKQLFTTPHQARKKRSRAIFETYDWLNISSENVKLAVEEGVHSSKITSLIYAQNTLCVGYENQELIPPRFKDRLSYELPNGSLILIDNQDVGKPKRSDLRCDLHYGRITTSCFLNIKYLAFGTDEGIITVWEYDISQVFDLSFFKSLHGHRSKIVCIASSSHHKYIISGSNDGICIQWDMVDFTFLRKISLPNIDIIGISIISSTADFVVFQQYTITFYSPNGEELTHAHSSHKIYHGIALNNDLHNNYQLVAITTSRGLELWKMGYDWATEADISMQVVENEWVECVLLQDSETENKEVTKRTISEEKLFNISILEKNCNEITCIYYSEKTKYFYLATSSGRVYRLMHTKIA